MQVIGCQVCGHAVLSWLTEVKVEELQHGCGEVLIILHYPCWKIVVIWGGEENRLFYLQALQKIQHSFIHLFVHSLTIYWVPSTGQALHYTLVKIFGSRQFCLWDPVRQFAIVYYSNNARKIYCTLVVCQALF